MLDERSTLHARDPERFLERLAALPDAYAGPDGEQPGPHGFDAAGAAAALAPVVADWFDGRLTPRGTQFFVADGFEDPEELAVRRSAVEAAGAAVVVIGPDDAAGEAGVADVRLPADALAPFHLVRYLAHASGRDEAGERLVAALRQVAAGADPARPTAENPAKALAWALWQRVPLLVSDRAVAAAQGLVQQAFARVGKTLAVPAGAHGALVASAAFEARHALADDLVALVLGRPGPETELIEEVLATRVAQVERLALGAGWLPPADADPVVDA
ncbi:MAG: hypothetical protein K0A98_06495, partial [Trueperaceae bacterium]|nr:hypothetical protein [Trueperaceae bacterium]